MSNRRQKSLAEIQARLEELVEQRTLRGLTARELTEWGELIAAEAEALANRGDFGQP